MADTAQARDRTVENLVDLVLHQLVPAVGWYRTQLAHHLGTGLPGLAVLEDAGQRPTTAARSALRIGMTPSAATKVIRKLELDGHVTRTPSGTHEQELLVELAPQQSRDMVLELIRTHVRGTVEHVVSALGLTADARYRIAAETLVQVAWALGQEAWEMEHVAANRAHAARRMRARERSGRRPFWEW
jgi:DNA-binding MarR family transcriptional regulator